MTDQIPVRICANAYLRVIFSAGCLGPNTSKRKAVRLHRMPRKQKAVITLSSKMFCGFTQKSGGHRSAADHYK